MATNNFNPKTPRPVPNPNGTRKKDNCVNGWGGYKLVETDTPRMINDLVPQYLVEKPQREDSDVGKAFIAAAKQSPLLYNPDGTPTDLMADAMAFSKFSHVFYQDCMETELSKCAHSIRPVIQQTMQSDKDKYINFMMTEMESSRQFAEKTWETKVKKSRGNTLKRRAESDLADFGNLMRNSAKKTFYSRCAKPDSKLPNFVAAHKTGGLEDESDTE